MGTALQANTFKDPNNIFETVYFEVGGNVNVELLTDNSVFQQYINSKSDLPYVIWLENKVKSLERII